MVSQAKSTCIDYFDARTLDAGAVSRSPLGCPVIGCDEELETAPSQWGDLPFCPAHGLRIHASSSKYVYYNGPDYAARRMAAGRNIVFCRDWFLSNVYGTPQKAETHRFGFETSEDALTWNVCAALADSGGLRELAEFLVGGAVPSSEPELYLWGLRIDLERSGPVSVMQELLEARDVFEADIARYRTEPDLMLLFPNDLLVVCEVKFTSGNTVASNVTVEEGEKPRNTAETLRRYSSAYLPQGVLDTSIMPQPFYTQLYRNLVFGVHMASALGVDWHVANLTSETQWRKSRGPEFEDPTSCVVSLLTKPHQRRFTYRVWEDFYTTCVKGRTERFVLDDYLRYKTAGMRAAFAVPHR